MILALFHDQDRLERALGRLRAAGIGPLETYTPAPLRNEGTASPIPTVILAAAVLGAAASLGLQSYSSMLAYPFHIGGRPQFAWPSFIPTVFENAVLVAVAAGFLAFMVVNRLPRLYDPVDEADMMREASRDGWIVAIRTGRAGVRDEALRVLQDLQPERIDEVAP